MASKKAKVLLIDDSIFARNLMRGILVKEGHNVCGEASNGRDGLAEFRALKPDIVFCDIMMDEMDGIECLKEMLAVNPEAKVVICTSASDELHVKDALSLGAKELLAKPINVDDLVRITNKLLGVETKPSYKKIMEDKAAEKGIEPKQVLDFFEAFRQFTGQHFDSKKVDENFLKENGARVTIGVRALLAAKMTSSEADQVMEIFESLY